MSRKPQMSQKNTTNVATTNVAKKYHKCRKPQMSQIFEIFYHKCRKFFFTQISFSIERKYVLRILWLSKIFFCAVIFWEELRSRRTAPFVTLFCSCLYAVLENEIWRDPYRKLLWFHRKNSRQHLYLVLKMKYSSFF